MSRKGYKSSKRRNHTGKHVQLAEWVQKTQAWATLKPGPRALYIELKRRFTGSNNGDIRLSHREAAALLNVHANTVGPWFRELEQRGFIRMREGPCLGPSGIGMTARWTLEELPTAPGEPAPKSFTQWRKIEKPPTKNQTPRPKSRDATRQISGKNGSAVLKIVT